MHTLSAEWEIALQWRVVCVRFVYKIHIHVLSILNQQIRDAVMMKRARMCVPFVHKCVHIHVHLCRMYVHVCDWYLASAHISVYLYRMYVDVVCT